MSNLIEAIFSSFTKSHDLRNFMILFPGLTPRLRVGNFRDENKLKLLNEMIMKKSFWPNGIEKSRIFYKNKRSHGIYISWYPNGKKRVESSYKNGKRDGIYKSWHGNGGLKTTGEFKNGKADGIWYYWDKNFARKVKEKQYIDGVLVSVASFPS